MNVYDCVPINLYLPHRHQWAWANSCSGHCLMLDKYSLSFKGEQGHALILGDKSQLKNFK